MTAIVRLSRTGGVSQTKATLLTFFRCEQGGTAIEYSLLGSLIAATLVTAVMALGGSLASTFDMIGAAIPEFGDGGGPPRGRGNGNNGNGLGNGGPNG